MTTVDNLLINLTLHTSPKIESGLPKRDAKVLRSLANAISDTNFITESQSRLLTKILLTHAPFLSSLVPNFTETLEQNLWSKPFRPVDRTKKVYTKHDKDNILGIFIEFAHSVTVRKAIHDLSSHLEGGLKVISSRFSVAELTEQNISVIVSKLKPLGFDIDEKILDFYENMKKWDLQSQCKSLFFGENLNPKIKNSLMEELSEDEMLNELLIADRSIRYHYFSKKLEENSEKLENLIACRTQTKIWIDNNKYSLDNLFASLQIFKKIPSTHCI